MAKKKPKKEKVIDIVRPSREIKTKVRIDFGNGVNRTNNEVKKLKEKHNVE
tara:strand:- start:6757 stop:6909 length:153 start_codon:yes stop_codon:yes gene_type:complete